ncbi:sugar ABC transporter substrate-binding protein [Pirellulales bacterium]|nr:sugar ABC transporter substrate-binding protein [Pirellulales bacterium]
MAQNLSTSTRCQAMLLVFAVMLAGCGKSSQDGPGEPGKNAKPRIALVMKSLANEFFSTMAEGAEAYHQQNAGDFDLVVNGIKDERDLARQVALVEEMVAGKVDAIVIAPADSKALIPVCKRAAEAGVVVINIDNKLDAGLLSEAGVQIPFIGPNNREGARQVGEHLAAQLSAGDQVVILEGVPTAYNAAQRKAGFEDAMKAKGIEIVDSQIGQWEMSIANTLAAAMLAERPTLKAILCSNDSMALGALAATRSAGKLDQVKIVGFDNISAIQQPIREGHVLATVDQHGDQLAVYGIEYALQVLDGVAAPEDRETPIDLVTAEQLKESS